MSDYNFVRFTNRGAKLGNCNISVNSSLSFGLLGGFYNQEKIKNFKKAILFFDKSKKVVAFSFTNDQSAEGAFTISHGKNSGSIASRSFFIGNELKQEKYWGQKIPKKIRDDKLGILYVIDLLSGDKNYDGK